jgi:drug/metabolite transporter (DMT)-like permease
MKGKKMNEHNTTKKAYTFSLTAGLLILTNTLLLGIVTTWFPGFLPTLPGQTANDPTVLYQLTTLGILCGAVVLGSAFLLQRKTTRQKTLGILIIVFSIPSVLTGGGFIIGFILGIIGGVFAIRKSTP